MQRDPDTTQRVKTPPHLFDEWRRRAPPTPPQNLFSGVREGQKHVPPPLGYPSSSGDGEGREGEGVRGFKNNGPNPNVIENKLGLQVLSLQDNNRVLAFCSTNFRLPQEKILRGEGGGGGEGNFLDNCVDLLDLWLLSAFALSLSLSCSCCCFCSCSCSCWVISPFVCIGTILYVVSPHDPRCFLQKPSPSAARFFHAPLPCSVAGVGEWIPFFVTL